MKAVWTDDQREAVKDMIRSSTGMLECTTSRQKANGTIAFRDHDLFETYTIHITGYARRTNCWGGNYQLNDKTREPHTYVWSGREVTIESSERILEACPFKLAAMVIRGHHDRRRGGREYVYEAAHRRAMAN